MKRLSAIVFILLCTYTGYPQDDCRYILSGHIEDADTKEKLSGATVFIKELHRYFITDANGDFKLSGICVGNYTIQVSHAGCETVTQNINVTKNQHLDVLLPHLRFNLEEVVVVESKKGNVTSAFHQALTQDQLEASKPLSIAEALSNINGVNILHTGSTISKPVIHGLHSMRVLTINNGIRQEGQQWGMEHAPEIDTYIAGNLTVLKGPEALRYGSDAIGGVVLVDAKPLRSLPGYGMEFNTAYSTNNQLFAASGIFENRSSKLSALSYRIQGTIKKGANINTPNYRLNNTGISEQNFSLTAEWRKEHYQLQAYYSEFASAIGIFPGSHIGNLTDLQNVISRDRPDEVFLGERTYKIDRPRQEILHRLFKAKASLQKNNHEFNLTFGGQYNHRDEFNIVRSRSNDRPQVSLAVITTTEEINYKHPTFHNVSGTLGISLMQQDNSYSGRYLIPNYISNTKGAYWLEKWKQNKWTVEAGLRFDNKSISTKRLKYNGERIDHDFDFSTFGSSLSAGYQINNLLRVTANAGLTSRAPHVNELLVDGVHEGVGTYEQGDIHLDVERSFDLSANFSFSSIRKNFSGEIYIYRNSIRDFIYQQPQPDEPVLTIVGAFPLISYRQTDAMLSGADVSLKYDIVKPLQINSRLSILRARNLATNDWMILMPADRWRNELVYRFNSKEKTRDTYASVELASVFKPRVPSNVNGKQDYKSPPGAYSVLNVKASTKIALFDNPLIVTLSIRNLFNKSYRDYLNSFRYYADDMGRNFTIMLKIPFDKSKK